MIFKRATEDGACRARVFLTKTDFAGGVVVDAKQDSVSIEFPADHAPLLHIAAKHVLALLPAGPPLIISGRVLRRSDTTDARCYEFQRDASSALDLAQLLVGRGAFRAMPRADDPIHVRASVPETEVTVLAQLHDISRSGLSLLVAPKDEEALLEAYRVQLSFRLPGSKKDFELPGIVRQRVLFGSMVRHGIAFDEERCSNFRHLKSQILRYVQKRRVEMIRQASEALEVNGPSEPAAD